MGHYFFHIDNPEGRTVDEEGRSCPSDDAAYDYAVLCVRGILAEELVLTGQLDLRGHVVVSGGDDDSAFCVPFDQSLTILS